MQEEQNTCPSLTKDRQFTSLGPRALTSCPLLLGGPGGGTFQDGKRQSKNSRQPQACLCVQCILVASIYITRVSCSCNKKLTATALFVLLQGTGGPQQPIFHWNWLKGLFERVPCI